MMSSSSLDQTSLYLRALSQTTRLKILLAIGSTEACVCHLEAAIGCRQAYISQQLMVLRQAGIVTSRRDGRNIYYRLRDGTVIDLIRQASLLSGIDNSSLPFTRTDDPLAACPCPRCTAERMQKLADTA